ncbi:MAG: AbrB/MazE/SpoVT family DNA-binding domain-containing protein [Bdellovibrionota bacterium]
MSSRGQVVIPESVRRKLGLKRGAQFVVVGRKDAVLLKALPAPPADEFELLLAEAENAARKAGMKRSDVAAAIRKVRRKK